MSQTRFMRADPVGNGLVLLGLSKGRYLVDDTGHLTGVEPQRDT